MRSLFLRAPQGTPGVIVLLLRLIPETLQHAQHPLASKPQCLTSATPLLSFLCVCRLNKQLGFSALEYGVGSGLFFLGYGVCILPSTFMTIKYGARRWLGAMTFLCGVVGMCHALLVDRQGFYALRCLLGVVEAAGGSSAGHVLAQFYPKNR